MKEKNKEHQIKSARKLTQKIGHLRTLDSARNVFGSKHHGYELQQHQPGEIEELSDFLGVSLPEQFSKHLISVGSGCGPYYGVLSPKEIKEEIQSLAHDYEYDTGRPLRPQDPFVFSEEEGETLLSSFVKGSDTPALKKTWPAPGCVPISHQGCDIWAVMVLTGKLRGTIWCVRAPVALDGLWYPEIPNPGMALRTRSSGVFHEHSDKIGYFEDWYSAWLEAATVQAQGH